MLLVTGGAGFIGSHFVRQWCQQHTEPVLNLDALTYAGNLANLQPLAGNPRHQFMHGDIRDAELLAHLLRRHQPRAIVHLAAESHVDRSIGGPAAFIGTNVTGTFQLLEAARHYWQALDDHARAQFRFLHVSTDEVYGSLGPNDAPCHEGSPYAPNSPYAASKAASDHLVRAYHQTYGLPTLITHCSNNYGPYQFPEKLLPRMIVNALAGAALPVYGDGQQVREWLHVDDHCAALRQILAQGLPGEVYAIGSGQSQTNLALVQQLCALLDTLAPASARQLQHPSHGTPLTHYAQAIAHVTDRLGHDRRYALDHRKLSQTLGWQPRIPLNIGLRDTVQWYLDHPDWIAAVQDGSYRTLSPETLTHPMRRA